jgi:curli biogenesis system outer membrane secretion channel CsgG
MKQIAIFLAFLLFASCAQYTDTTKTQTLPGKKVSPVLEQNQKKVLKRKVAIARFSNETKYSKGFFYDGQNDLVGKQASDILSTKLAQTEKFILLERSDIKSVTSELEMGEMDKLKINADYLIVGSVSEFGRQVSSSSGIFTRSKKQTAHAKVNVRLIDVSTGQILYSEEGEGEAFTEDGTVIGIGNRAGHDSSIDDKAITVAISNLVNNIVSNLLEKPWRSYILDFSSGQYTISGGKTQGIGVGDVFDVYEKGKNVKNPQTGMPVTLPGKLVGKLKVQTLSGDTPQNEVSFCVSISGTIPESKFENLYIQEKLNN